MKKDLKEEKLKCETWLKDFEKVNKKQRSSIFENEIVWNLSIDKNITFEGFTKYSNYVRWFYNHTKLGVIEYYPKSDMVHIHKRGNSGWISNGIRWVVNNLPNYNFKN